MRAESEDGLSAALRRLRAAAGLTQEELAERAGISARTVSDIERGLRVTVYPDTARRLSNALEIQPDRRAELEALLRGRPRPHDDRVPTIPVVPTPLIGRASELGAITQALAMSNARLLTLTGPGGIGKTRLAAEAAHRLRGTFPDGVIFVQLDAVSDAELVAPAIARTLGVAETGGAVESVVERALRSRRSLVVLDTFEHVHEASGYVASLLQAVVAARFLVTSRRPLHVRGELEFPVPPLDVPEALGPDPVADLRRWPATELFVERMLSLDPRHQLDEDGALAVLEICRRLNGLPLAIELAASRAKTIPLHMLAVELDALGVLTRGPVDLPPRHRTMRAAVGWSHGLLAPSAKILFRRLSAFRDGWDVPAMRDVCRDSVDDAAMFDDLSTLVDHSLVVFDPAARGARYRMLDVIREYAAERLAELTDEAQLIARRHALHYLAFAEEAEHNLVRAEQEEWVRRLDVERGNLRTAIAWTIANGEAVLAHRFVVALWRYWRHTGELAEGRRWSEAALRLDGVPDGLRAKALWGTAFIAFPQGDYERMAELAAQDLVVARRGDDQMDLRNALTIAGQVAMCEGRYGDALEPLRGSLEICQRLGLSWQLGTSYLNYGNALLHSGDLEAAEQAYANGLAAYLELGDATFAARMRLALAQAALARGDVREADALARDALRGFAAQRERLGVAEALDALAGIAAATGDAERSARLDGAAHAVQTTIASRPAPFERSITRSFIERARSRADPASWRSAWEEGNALRVDEAVGAALEVADEGVNVTRRAPSAG